MQTYINTINTLPRSALEGELTVLRTLPDKYRDEVRAKTNLILLRLKKY